MYAIVGKNDDNQGGRFPEIVWGTGKTPAAAWEDARVWIAEYVDHPLHDTAEKAGNFNAEIDTCREVVLTDIQAEAIAYGETRWPIPAIWNEK